MTAASAAAGLPAKAGIDGRGVDGNDAGEIRNGVVDDIVIARDARRGFTTAGDAHAAGGKLRHIAVHDTVGGAAAEIDGVAADVGKAAPQDQVIRAAAHNHALGEGGVKGEPLNYKV